MEKAVIPPALDTRSLPTPLSQHPQSPFFVPPPATEGPSTDLEARSQRPHQPAAPPTQQRRPAHQRPAPDTVGRAEECLRALPLPTSPLHPEVETATKRWQEFAPLHLPTCPCPIITGWVRGRAPITGASEPTQTPIGKQRESRSRTDSEKVSGHQTLKADRGRSGEKEAGGCGKIVPSLPHPVIPPWPSLAYWVAAGSQASVAGLLALRIPAPPLHPEPLWELGHPASGSVGTAVSHSPRRKSPPSTSPHCLTPATPSLPLASLFPPWGLGVRPHRGPSGLPALLEPLALPTLLSPTQ